MIGELRARGTVSWTTLRLKDQSQLLHLAKAEARTRTKTKTKTKTVAPTDACGCSEEIGFLSLWRSGNEQATSH